MEVSIKLHHCVQYSSTCICIVIMIKFTFQDIKLKFMKWTLEGHLGINNHVIIRDLYERLSYSLIFRIFLSNSRHLIIIHVVSFVSYILYYFVITKEVLLLLYNHDCVFNFTGCDLLYLLHFLVIVNHQVVKLTLSKMDFHVLFHLLLMFPVHLVYVHSVLCSLSFPLEARWISFIPLQQHWRDIVMWLYVITHDII